MNHPKIGNLSIAKISFIYVHAIPFVNNNGHCFEIKTLKNSHETIIGKPINDDHTSKKIVGYMSESKLVKDRGLDATEVTGTIWKRIYPEIVAELKSGRKKISMEVLTDRYEIYHAGKFYDSNHDLKAYIGQSIQGEKVGLVVGGTDGFIEFSGCGIVDNPADKYSTIKNIEATIRTPDESFTALVACNIIQAVEVNKNTIRIPVTDINRFKKIVSTISIAKGIKAVIGILKESGKSRVRTFLFDRKEYTLKEAKDWVKKHGYSISV